MPETSKSTPPQGESNISPVENRIRAHLFRQFNDQTAQRELKEMSVEGIDWPERVNDTLNHLIPRLPSIAAHLKNEVPNRLNSAATLLKVVAEGRMILGLGAQGEVVSSEISKWFSQLEISGTISAGLVNNIDSQHVSAEIQRQILEPHCLGEIALKNGGSLYPDIFLKERDYSSLPSQSSRKKIDGPCLRKQFPSNVPDGCELKCNQGQRVRVDAHAPHAGLHIGVTWDRSDGLIQINGVWVAYIRIADCRESGRNVRATTVKYSFGHDLFVSTLP